jgi:hypothetical protein
MRTQPTSGDQERHRIQTELVDVLERTRLLAAANGRALMLDELRDRLGQRLPLREYAELRPQLVELVRACAAHPGAVSTMVEVVVHIEPDTHEASRLRRLGDEWEATDVLAGDDWFALRPALEAIAPANLGWLCQRATEHRLASPPSWCANAWHVFVHLAGRNAGLDGLPPHMVFLILLEQEVDPATAERIRSRNRQQASEQGLTQQLDHRRSHISSGLDQPRDATAYLVIQLEPELEPGDDLDDLDDGAEETQRYRLSHFRQWRGVDTWHTLAGAGRTVRRDQLEREVERLIDQLETDWADRPGTTVIVEFILPWELLNAEVDWWPRESGSARPTALAMDYPVVIRSLERLRTPRWHRAWHQRWQRLQAAPATTRVYWSRPSGEDYFTRLETELKSDERVVSLILSEPPTVANRTGQQEVEAALRAGLPVIVWHRQDCTSPAFREGVTRLISDAGLAQLPARAKELRLEALRLEPKVRQDHIGRHLTVLWCDPERKPDPVGSSSGRFAEETR